MNPDSMSISMASMCTLNDSLGYNFQDDDDKTVTRTQHDARVLQPQEEDENYEGNRGTSDAEGEGYKAVQRFRLDTKEATDNCLIYGDDDVDEGILDTEDNFIPCLVRDNKIMSMVTSFYGAPPGWKLPAPEDDWRPHKIKALDSGFSILSRRSLKSKRREALVNIICITPCHRSLFRSPKTQLPTKEWSEDKGYEFFYQGWKHPNPTMFNCWLGSDVNTVFPDGREVQLKAPYLRGWTNVMPSSSTSCQSQLLIQHFWESRMIHEWGSMKKLRITPIRMHMVSRNVEELEEI
jgi:hypothetical protein